MDNRSILDTEEYDKWKLQTPEEDKDSICRYCGEECEGEFCDKECANAYWADME